MNIVYDHIFSSKVTRCLGVNNLYIQYKYILSLIFVKMFSAVFFIAQMLDLHWPLVEIAMYKLNIIINDNITKVLNLYTF